MKKIKACISLILFFLMMLSMSGCASGGFFAALGFDTYDYKGEKVIAEHTPDSEIALEICEAVKIFTVNSADIPTFNGTKEAAASCRDGVLNYLLSRSYSKYSGNPELLDNAKKVYPMMNFSSIIPAEDFENTVYRYFGGKEKVNNESSSRFRYMEGIEAYVTACQPEKNDITVNIRSINETESTYQVTFFCTLDEYISRDYFALAVKREDGTFYFKYVEFQNDK